MRRGNLRTKEKENLGDVKVKKSNIDKRKLVSLVISLITILTSIITVATIVKIGILPFKYLIALVLGLVIVNAIFSIVLLKNKKGKITRNIINVLQVILTVLQVLVIIYGIKTYSFIDKMNEETNTKKENYAVIVLKDSKYNEIKDLDGKVIEYYSNEIDNSMLAVEKLKEKVNISAVSNEDVYVVGKTLLESEVDAILLEESQKLILDEELEGFANKTKVVYTLAVDITVETIAKEAAVASDPFIVYISGIDTYGTIASVSRSDVNMVAVINPKTYQVLLVNIPRDYYVRLHGTSGKRDKLTHAGMYGVEKSVKTIEDLLDIDINYYFKVNFTSLETIVDSIGGVEVYSEYAFTEYKGRYSYVKGYNKLNGAQALAFARERKAFSNGDRMRGKNQQAVLSAIVEQASKPAIITKFDSLLKSLSDKFQTNMDTSKMMELVKLQISKMPTWNISTVSLTGGDARALAYSSGSTPLYVMLPSQNSINDAMNKIQTIISGGALEGAYDSVTGNITSLREIEIPVVEEPEEEIVEEPTDDEVVDSEAGDNEIGDDTNTDAEDNTNKDNNDSNTDTGKDTENGENSGGNSNTDKETDTTIPDDTQNKNENKEPEGSGETTPDTPTTDAGSENTTTNTNDGENNNSVDVQTAN